MDIAEILKRFQKGSTLYSILHGNVELVKISEYDSYPIEVRCLECSSEDNRLEYFTRDGKYVASCNGECVLFPGRDNRDWSSVG